MFPVNPLILDSLGTFPKEYQVIPPTPTDSESNMEATASGPYAKIPENYRFRRDLYVYGPLRRRHKATREKGKRMLLGLANAQNKLSGTLDDQTSCPSWARHRWGRCFLAVMMQGMFEVCILSERSVGVAMWMEV